MRKAIDCDLYYLVSRRPCVFIHETVPVYNVLNFPLLLSPLLAGRPCHVRVNLVRFPQTSLFIDWKAGHGLLLQYAWRGLCHYRAIFLCKRRGAFARRATLLEFHSLYEHHAG
jgi:hypothetical protein